MGTKKKRAVTSAVKTAETIASRKRKRQVAAVNSAGSAKEKAATARAFLKKNQAKTRKRNG